MRKRRRSPLRELPHRKSAQNAFAFCDRLCCEAAQRSFSKGNWEHLWETEEEKKETEQKNEDNKALLDFVKETLGGDVSAVRISHKLVSHPVCLTSEGSVTLEMEKYFAAIPGENKVKAQRVLELNGDHPVFAQLKNAFETDKELAAKYAKILYAQALLIAGFPLEDPAGYSELVCGLLR